MKQSLFKPSVRSLVKSMTNKDHWGPSNRRMFRLAKYSNANPKKVSEINSTIWKRIDQIKHVRRSQKAMILLEFMILNGNDQFRELNKVMVSTFEALKGLQTQEGGERAILESIIRTKAENIMKLVTDDDYYREQRHKSLTLKHDITSYSENRNHHIHHTYKGHKMVKVPENPNKVIVTDLEKQQNEEDESYSDEDDIPFEPSLASCMPRSSGLLPQNNCATICVSSPIRATPKPVRRPPSVFFVPSFDGEDVERVSGSDHFDDLTIQRESTNHKNENINNNDELYEFAVLDLKQNPYKNIAFGKPTELRGFKAPSKVTAFC